MGIKALSKVNSFADAKGRKATFVLGDHVEALLLELVAEVRGLRADLRERAPPAASLCRADRARLERLLPAIGGTFGSELVSSAEIAEHDSAALRLVCAGLGVKQLGRLLRRGADVPIEGHVVAARVGSRRALTAYGHHRRL